MWSKTDSDKTLCTRHLDFMDGKTAFRPDHSHDGALAGASL
jgi:hypothetical protein